MEAIWKHLGGEEIVRFGCKEESWLERLFQGRDSEPPTSCPTNGQTGFASNRHIQSLVLYRDIVPFSYISRSYIHCSDVKARC